MSTWLVTIAYTEGTVEVELTLTERAELGDEAAAAAGARARRMGAPDGLRVKSCERIEARS
jgi:hypothetical protein